MGLGGGSSFIFCWRVGAERVGNAVHEVGRFFSNLLRICHSRGLYFSELARVETRTATRARLAAADAVNEA